MSAGDPVAENFSRIALWNAFVAPAVDRGFITNDISVNDFFDAIVDAAEDGGEDAAQAIFDDLETASTPRGK